MVPTWVILALMLIAFLWVAASFLVPYWKRIKNHPFADRNTVDVVFRERRASGNSDKDWFSKIGGASRCLTVAVTATELWVYGPDLLIRVTSRSDLDHRILLSDITRVEREGRRGVVVSFALGDGTERILRLVVKDADGLVSAITTGC